MNGYIDVYMDVTTGQDSKICATTNLLSALNFSYSFLQAMPMPVSSSTNNTAHPRKPKFGFSSQQIHLNCSEMKLSQQQIET